MTCLAFSQLASTNIKKIFKKVTNRENVWDDKN